MIPSRVRFGEGVRAELPGIVREAGVRRVFMIVDTAACRASGAWPLVEEMEEAFRSARFEVVRALPRLEEVAEAASRARAHRPDAYVAIGGGTAIDLAKLVMAAATLEDGAGALLQPVPDRYASPALLVACPTTAGSGSEATHFAVVYAGGVKRSVAHPALLPDVAIVDPELTWSVPAYQTAATAFDAFTQAVESFWSVRATPASQALAREAMQLAWAHLPAIARAPTVAARRDLARAAHLAGRAINRTATTACHALSYDLSFRYGVAHGHAVALTMPGVLAFNALVTDDDVCDPRGAGYVRTQIQSVCAALGFESVTDTRRAIAARMRDAGLATSLAELGVADAAARAALAAGVNRERLANNPRRLRDTDVSALLDAIA